MVFCNILLLKSFMVIKTLEVNPCFIAISYTCILQVNSVINISKDTKKEKWKKLLYSSRVEKEEIFKQVKGNMQCSYTFKQVFQVTSVNWLTAWIDN